MLKNLDSMITSLTTCNVWPCITLKPKKYILSSFFAKKKIESSLLALTCCIALSMKMLTPSQRTFKLLIRAWEFIWMIIFISLSQTEFGPLEGSYFIVLVKIRLNSLKNLQSKSKFSNDVCIAARYQQFNQHWRNPFLSKLTLTYHWPGPSSLVPKVP